MNTIKPNQAEIRVGHFTCRGGVISGPEEYMAERGAELIAKINNLPGADFQEGKPSKPDGITAILIRFQVDFTEWLIMKLLSENLLSPANARSFTDILMAVEPKYIN
jgi:hypothetical protein